MTYFILDLEISDSPNEVRVSLLVTVTLSNLPERLTFVNQYAYSSLWHKFAKSLLVFIQFVLEFSTLTDKCT